LSDSVTVSLEDVHRMSTDALLGQGFSSQQATAIANTITSAERDECYSHGLFRIPFYVKVKANPDTNVEAVPELHATSSSIVHVDARNGFCPLALETGLPALVEKTKERGIAALAIHNVYNIAALWPEVESLAQQDLVAFAFTGASAFVAPHGGTKPLFGTNPMAFSWPRSNQPPLVFDQASSVSARGEIQLHALRGESLPSGWAIDKDGQPTTDPAAALAGAQLPFGGYKGSSIALMVELLAGALIGDLFSYESKEKDKLKVGAPYGGEFLMAIDPAHCQLNGDKASAIARAEQLFERVLAQEGTRLPSMRRYAARERTKVSGVVVPKKLHDEISAYA